MSRAAQSQAKDTFNSAQGVAGTAGSNAQGIFSPLLQSYQEEAGNPQGIGLTGLNAENTSSQQSTGGATAGAVGQANQMAARTRNAGGFQIANDEAARSAMRQNSQNAVQNVANNEMLKQQQKQAGLAGQASLYGQNLNAQLGALGAQNNATGELNQAGQSGWLQNTLGVLNTAANLGSAAGGLGAKPFAPGCWIAAELYGGWENPRTILIREWMGSEFNKSALGRAVLALYARFGERIATVMKTNKIIRVFFVALFDQALKKATDWRANARS